MRIKLDPGPSNEYRCCYCMHVLTGTTLLGMFHMVSFILFHVNLTFTTYCYRSFVCDEQASVLLSVKARFDWAAIVSHCRNQNLPKGSRIIDLASVVHSHWRLLDFQYGFVGTGDLALLTFVVINHHIDFL